MKTKLLPVQGRDGKSLADLRAKNQTFSHVHDRSGLGHANELQGKVDWHCICHNIVGYVKPSVHYFWLYRGKRPTALLWFPKLQERETPLM
jgi:hypothetical protein